jgi:hypothetical protein
MSAMFREGRSLNQPVKFDTSSVVYMDSMFCNAVTFNQDVSAFAFGQNIRGMSDMFNGASSFSQNLTAWSGTIFQGTNVARMFNGTACPNQGDPNLNGDSARSLLLPCIGLKTSYQGLEAKSRTIVAQFQLANPLHVGVKGGLS